MTVTAAPAPTRPEPWGAHAPRVLLPFAGPLDPSVLEVAVAVAQAEEASLVAAYLSVVPLRYRQDSPLHDEAAWAAAPLFEGIERMALDAGVPVTTRIATGRALTHALARLWAAERFTCVVATVSAAGEPGLTETDLAWLVAHAPAAALVLRPERGREPGRNGVRLSAGVTA